MLEMSIDSRSRISIRPGLFALLMLLGALARVAGLPAHGSPDVIVFKIWSYAAAHGDPSRMYGTGNNWGPEFDVADARGEGSVVQYPPLALYIFAASGRLYRAFFPAFPSGLPLTIMLKLTAILASALLTALIWRVVSRRYGETTGRLAAIFYWANPAVILLEGFLGYIDPWFALPAIAAVFAATEGAAVASGVLLAAGLMIKPQAVFAGPAIVMALAAGRPWREWRPLLRAAVSGAATCLALVWPVVHAHAFVNMLFALRGTISDGMLSGDAANLWWIAGDAIRPAARAEIVQMSSLLFAGRKILGHGAGGLVMVTTTWAILVALMLSLMWHARRSMNLLTATGLTALVVHLYVVLGVQVHENHLFLAIPALAIAAALDARYRLFFAALTSIAFLNLNLFFGSGYGYTSALRDHVHLVDLTVVLAAVNVAALAWHFFAFLAVTRECRLLDGR